MPTGPAFTLEVDTDPAAGVVRLHLTDEAGRQVGANQVKVADHSPSLWHGLFDTRAYIHRYAEKGKEADLLAQLGAFLGEKVLGTEILNALADGFQSRTLLVRVPEAAKDRLAAAFARVPWEIARSAAGEESLLERNLVVRLEAPQPITVSASPLGENEELRVLLVFAEAPGSRPLAMRLEREQLLALFYDDVMPQRKVTADVLCHGVTRKALKERVRDASGYHVVHWSGHGHQNLLELLGEDGKPDRLSGADLVKLFDQAGGFIPQLVFLSACLSGALVEVRDWAALRAAPRQCETGTRESAPEAADPLAEEPPGYTGTALALLGAGVPQVVAMRYEVGDAYARDLAGLFYRGLLADSNPKTPAVALAVARRELLDRCAAEHAAVDHATPLLFGAELGPLAVPRGRSSGLRYRRPQPQPLLTDSHELDRPPELAGRSEPLSRLRGCLEEGKPAVALVQGLAGMGKTTLVAEAVHLWHRRFVGVFAFQSKPLKLPLDEFYRRLDERLALHSQAYREICDANPNARVYLPAGKPLSGDERWRQMRGNLLEALRNENLVLVLDNFETNLEQVTGEDGNACADPEWDRLLVHLADNLSGTGSRLLVTSRHRLSALASPARAAWLPLGPLPIAEPGLFLQGTEVLRRLALPLILFPLVSELAGDQQALEKALALATKARLVEANSKEGRDYLEDVAIGSVDLLIRLAKLAARRLLWLVALAGEPVLGEIITGVWSGRSLEEERADQLRELLDKEDQLPEELRKLLAKVLPEMRAALEQQDVVVTTLPVGPLLAELQGVGLLLVKEEGTYGLHELVRERTTAWMADHPEEKSGRTEEQIWEAYGERYGAMFKAIRDAGGEGTMERAVEAGRRGIFFLIRARAFDRLDSFASEVVTSTRDPRLLRGVIAELEGVVEQIPVGEPRWRLRTYLADALGRAGRPEAALPFYEQAAAEAEDAGRWDAVGAICQNWANALRDVGRLDNAKDTSLRSAEAKRRAGSARLSVLRSELEALRVDVMQGGAEEALPEIESRLQEVRSWWWRHRAGEPVPEAPEAVALARALISGLDIARTANLALMQWETCLAIVAELEEAERALGESEHELARTRFYRYWPLLRLGRLDEAQRVLEDCLEFFRGSGDLTMEASTLSALAGLWDERGDDQQAAGLARRGLAVFNRLSDLADRSRSHNNLANGLDRLGAAEEAARHQLAAIVYDLVTAHRQLLAGHLRNLAIFMRRAAASGGRYELPRLAELLARPEFEPLQRTLAEWNVAVEELQGKVDQVVEEVRGSL